MWVLFNLSSNKGTNLNSPNSCFSNWVSFFVSAMSAFASSPNGMTSLPYFNFTQGCEMKAPAVTMILIKGA
jgi:hypothetical protein